MRPWMNTLISAKKYCRIQKGMVGGLTRHGTNVTLNARGRTATAHRVIDNYFPLAGGTGNRQQGERPSLRGRGLSSTKENDGDMGILEPGEMYTIYDAKDVLGNLSGDLKMIVERSARWAGVDCDFVCGVVERYERRLVRWWNDRRHGRKGEGEDQDQEEGR